MAGILTWGGLAVALGGVALLGLCIARLRRLRAESPEKAEFDRRIRGLVALNAAAVGTGFLGVAIMILGAVL